MSKFSRLMPRTIHQIWLGERSPRNFEPWMSTWRQKHPQWHYKLWRDADLVDFPFVTGDLVPFMDDNPGLRSDIVRLEILHRFGGLYADTDTKCERPFDGFIEGVDAEVFTGWELTGNVGIGLIGAIPGAQPIRTALERVKVEMDRFRGRFPDAKPADLYVNGPIRVLARELATYPEVTMFPAWVFHDNACSPAPERMVTHFFSSTWRTWDRAKLKTDTKSSSV